MTTRTPRRKPLFCECILVVLIVLALITLMVRLTHEISLYGAPQ